MEHEVENVGSASIHSLIIELKRDPFDLSTILFAKVQQRTIVRDSAYP